MAEANPKKQQMEYIAIGALVLVALFIGMTRFKKKDKDDEVFSRKEFNKKWEEVKALEKSVPEDEKAIAYTVYSERAPFKSPFEGDTEELGEDVTLPKLNLQGMVWSSQRPQAIIDNKVYDVGDVIEIGSGEAKEEIKINDIDRDGLHLRYKGMKFIVRPK